MNLLMNNGRRFRLFLELLCSFVVTIYKQRDAFMLSTKGRSNDDVILHYLPYLFLYFVALFTRQLDQETGTTTAHIPEKLDSH